MALGNGKRLRVTAKCFWTLVNIINSFGISQLVALFLCMESPMLQNRVSKGRMGMAVGASLGQDTGCAGDVRLAGRGGGTAFVDRTIQR